MDIFVTLGNRAELGIGNVYVKQPEEHYTPEKRICVQRRDYGEIEYILDLGPPTAERIDELIDHLQRLKVFCN